MDKDIKIVCQQDLEHAESVTFSNAAYFTRTSKPLPTPTEVSELAKQLNPDDDRRRTRPAPVVLPECGLLVKWGLEVNKAEGQCLRWLNQHMRDVIPTPEVYGWTRDGKETFIYMELIEGQTLQDAWKSLSQEARVSVCSELRDCLTELRTIRQDGSEPFIGHIGRQGVAEILLERNTCDPWPGPFDNLSAFHDYFAQRSCLPDSKRNARRDFREVAGLSDSRRVVFTHCDLARCNILITQPQQGQVPRLAAIIDWHQSGWYPEDWEWVKTSWVSDPLDRDWIDNWVDFILPHPDDG